ncbi:Cacna1h [Symbiodinium sp. CCMP2456]|nr:Cacna1h [Symbiodinium sp. CCMP2456]
MPKLAHTTCHASREREHAAAAFQLDPVHIHVLHEVLSRCAYRSQGQPGAVDLVPNRPRRGPSRQHSRYRPAMPGSPPDHGERPYEETLGIDTGATQALQQLLLEQETNLLASFQELLKEQEARINLSLLAGLDRRMDALLSAMPHGAVAGRRTLSAAKPVEKPAHLREEAPGRGKPKADDADQKRDAFGDRQSPLKRSFTRQFHVELPHAGQDMRRWWYGEEPILPTDTRMQAWGKRSRKFLESPTFGKALAALIFLNCCSLGWQVDWGVQNHASPEPAHFEVLGMMFTLIFLAEFGIRCFAYGRAMYICQNPDVGWNTFDGLLVLSSLVDEIMSRAASGINVTALRVLRLARLLRILRVFRVVRYFTDLRVMVNGILVSSKTLVWALVLLFMLMFAVAACILQLLRPYLSSLDLSVEAKEQLAQQLLLHFGTLLGGIFTLFSSMSGGVDWADVARMLNEVSLLLALLFVVYMCFALFCVLNVMTGVFVENASRMTAADEEMCMMEELRARKDYVDTVSRLFSECDIDNSGNVNWEASKGSKGRRKKKDKSGTSNRPLKGIALPSCQTAPKASRSAALYSDPKMKALKSFVHKVEAAATSEAAPEQTPQVSLMEDSFGDDEPSQMVSELDSGSDLSPALLASRRGSASSTWGRTYGGYSRRTSAAASSRRTSAAADSRRTSASSFMGGPGPGFGRRQSEETVKSVNSLPKANLQTTFESISERPSYEGRRASFRPASASAVLQSSQAQSEQPEHVLRGRVDKKARQLLEEAQKQQKQQLQLSLSLDEQLEQWMTRRDDEVKKQEAAAHQARRSWRTERESLEARRRQLHFFDMKGVKDHFLNRAGHSLKKLFLDFDLAHNAGGQARSHEARCKHLDGVYEWYEKHASLKGQSQTSQAPGQVDRSPWIFIKHGEAQPPGSLRRPRSAAATFAGSGHAPPGLPRAVSAPRAGAEKSLAHPFHALRRLDEEFQACASDLHFQTCFKKLGIAIDTESELRNVFDMLDFQNNGSVSVEEFAIGIQMFSGGAKSIDVARLMFEVATVKKYMANVHEALVGPVDPDDHPEFIGAQQHRQSEVVSEEMLPGEVPGQHDAKPTEDGQGMQGVVPVHAPMKAWLD